MNVSKLTSSQIAWADLVFLSGMLIQRESTLTVATQARALGKRIVVGGPDATTSPEAYENHADVIVMGEAESLMGPLATALESSEPIAKRWQAPQRPCLNLCPVPRYDLLHIKSYVSMAVQWSRGCPFNCEFCDIIEVFGRKPRTKSPEQLCRELDAIVATGFHGSLFFVDDNFVGNKAEAQKLLPTLCAWMHAHDFPFDLYTEASVNLASEDALIDAMVAAGFNAVFLGIETANLDTLRDVQKFQNTKLCLSAAVEKLVSRGLEVMGGFIVGFDSDDEAAIERQREWVLGSLIPMAMVGLLTALPGTQLARRLAKEGRLLDVGSGDNFISTNFVTGLDEERLLDGYVRLLSQIYSPKAYFERALRVIKRRPTSTRPQRGGLRYGLSCLVRSIIRQGFLAPYRMAYWRFLRKAILRRPRSLAYIITLAIKGEHLIRYTAHDVLPKLKARLEELRSSGRHSLSLPHGHGERTVAP
jgi:radical SAM superfamily enzyme YgiQ (UPF0313 family)